MQLHPAAWSHGASHLRLIPTLLISFIWDAIHSIVDMIDLGFIVHAVISLAVFLNGYVHKLPSYYPWEPNSAVHLSAPF